MYFILKCKNNKIIDILWEKSPLSAKFVISRQLQNAEKDVTYKLYEQNVPLSDHKNIILGTIINNKCHISTYKSIRKAHKTITKTVNTIITSVINNTNQSTAIIEIGPNHGEIQQGYKQIASYFLKTF